MVESSKQRVESWLLGRISDSSGQRGGKASGSEDAPQQAVLMSDPLSIAAEWLTREQAAEYIRCRTGIPITRDVLANRANLGDGPPYRIWSARPGIRRGRGVHAVYRPCDLDKWISTQLHEPAVTHAADRSK